MIRIPSEGLFQDITSIDVYVTYKCGLRCNHCFVGDHLDLGTHFEIGLLREFLNHAPSWGAGEITFLGGEPTRYPHIDEAVALVRSLGMRARLVTNGQTSFSRFIERVPEPADLNVYLSIDGSNARIHDSIRGRGTFARLMRSATLLNQRGVPTSGIVSIQRRNCDDAERLMRLCAELGFRHVNVHYVTSRGFADKESVLGVDEWQEVVNRIEAVSRQLPIDIRIERTFAEADAECGECAVRAKDNLMVFPDGRVFMCAMFIDVPNAHSYTWTSSGLVQNASLDSEVVVCADDCRVHCPAMDLVNPEIASIARQRGLKIRCIYDKSRVRHGRQVADIAPLPNE